MFDLSIYFSGQTFRTSQFLFISLIHNFFQENIDSKSEKISLKLIPS